MRISDWSSDVCSSDRAGLAFAQAHGKVALGGVRGVLFDFDAGRAECDHARAYDKRLRVPAGEMIERPADKDRVDARIQAFHRSDERREGKECVRMCRSLRSSDC